MVRPRRLELPRPFGHQHLKLARLPFRHGRTFCLPRKTLEKGLQRNGTRGYQIGGAYASFPAGAPQ